MMRLQLSPNPVLVKELRGRMRGPRAYIFLTATLLLMGAVSYGLYRIALASTQSSLLGGGPPGSSNPPGFVIGQCVFTGLVFLALIVICAIAPALTARAISSEHESKTFDLLAATPLRPSSILFGKLAAALSYVALILLAAVPLVSLSFVFGGVPLKDMLQALLLLLGFALTYNVIGLFFSSWLRRSGSAVALSYIVLALFVFGTAFLYIFLSVTRGRQAPHWLLALNPFSAMASALVIPPQFNTFSPGMFPVMSLLWTLAGGSMNFGGFQAPLPTPLWRYTVGFYAWLTVLLYLVSTQLVKPVGRVRLRSPLWLIIGLYLTISVVAAPFVYQFMRNDPGFDPSRPGAQAPIFIQQQAVPIAVPPPPVLRLTATPTLRSAP